MVTAEAKRSFEAALQLDPKDSRARFFAGLAKEQSGDKVAALDDWIAILNEVDPNDPSISDVMAKASELGRSIGVDVAKRVQRPQVSATADVSKPPLEPQHPQPAGAAAEELSLSSD